MRPYSITGLLHKGNQSWLPLRGMNYKDTAVIIDVCSDS